MASFILVYKQVSIQMSNVISNKNVTKKINEKGKERNHLDTLLPFLSPEFQRNVFARLQMGVKNQDKYQREKIQQKSWIQT
jgi:hypothetical protein